MKNPLYPTTLIDNKIIKNYNKCIIITVKNLNEYVSPVIFNEDVNGSYFEDISKHYNINEVPMWMIRLIPEYYKKFIIFDITEDSLLKFNFSEKIIYNIQNACILIPNHSWNWFVEFIEPFSKDGIILLRVVPIYNKDTVPKIINGDLRCPPFGISQRTQEGTPCLIPIYYIEEQSIIEPLIYVETITNFVGAIHPSLLKSYSLESREKLKNLY